MQAAATASTRACAHGCYKRVMARIRSPQSPPPSGLNGARGELPQRFERWLAAIDRLPRRQTRVLTWPLATVFGFIAQPGVHMFLKPNTIRAAARAYGYELPYRPRPSWDVYAGLLGFCALVKRDLGDLRPRDMIDIQSFLWVQGSDEY
jgi:hypothetical protein